VQRTVLSPTVTCYAMQRWTLALRAEGTRAAFRNIHLWCTDGPRVELTASSTLAWALRLGTSVWKAVLPPHSTFVKRSRKATSQALGIGLGMTWAPFRERDSSTQ
jgi:hypothetical protein